MANKPTKYRKFSAGAATATLVATAIVPTTFAAEVKSAGTDFSDVASTHTHYAAIMQAVERGLFDGYKDGTFKPENSIDRKGVVKSLAKYVISQSDYKNFEEYVTANKLADKVTPFKDVPATHGDKELYYASLIVKESGIFKGSNNNLMPANNITRQQMAQVLVNGFGLKDLAGVESKVTDNAKAQQQFVKYINILSENGVTEVTAFNPTGDVKRGQMASFLNRSFDVAHPVVDNPTPEVVSVNADNLKQFSITFNSKVDKASAEDIANYSLADVTSGATADLTNGSVKLQDEGKTVLITLGKEARQQDEVKVTVEDVVNEKNVPNKKYEGNVTFFDRAAPTVETLRTVGPRSVEINFSEPLAAAPTVKLDNGSISTAVTIDPSNRSRAVVEFGIAPTEGAHSLEIEGGQDYASYKVAKTTKEFNYAVDTTVPTVTIDKAAPDQVTFKFSKPVKVTNAGNVSFYHTVNNSANYVGTGLTAVNAVNGFADTFTVNFATPLPEGTSKLFLNTKENAFEDAWGNDVASAELSANVVLDKTAPSVTKVDATTDKKFVVTFSEEVNETTAELAANYALTDSAGKAISLTGATFDYDNSKKTVTVTLPTNLKPGSYSLVVKNIEDLSYEKNKLTSQTINVAIPDSTAWDVKSAVKSGNNIRVTFSEAMSTEELTSLSNYSLRNKDVMVNHPAGTSIVVINNSTVEIRLPAGNTVINNIDGVRVSGSLKDAAGNVYSNTDYILEPVSNDALDEVSLVKDSAMTATNKTVKFQLNQELQGSLNPSLFTVADPSPAGTFTFGGASYENNNGKATVTLTLAANSTTSSFAPNQKLNVVATAGALTNTFGTTNSAFTISVKDGIAPSVEKGNDGKLLIDNNTATGNVSDFTIDFDEALSASTALWASDLVITKVDGDRLKAGDDYTVTATANGDTATVTLVNGYATYTGALSVATVKTPAYIRDVAGNTANAFGATTVTIE
ncbi:S-layer homology domain-containing protein [Psychrobacillus sp. INOP01]|uniref:S-layer homology domain-containing protein n=1 Tax=Psychrobacillus sp. INOP01 TaxID=2829187 RepID=UPI001BADF055|nr:S-layer homology domain-containing protein [Psychrobacillus sp. INOP01]QUG40561.1 S-layer homology domain-containing protein [Psychrobacillus sp. INOP01]